MPRDRREVEAALVAKGFRQRQGDHRFFLYWSLAGFKTPVFTKTSHGQKEIGDVLLKLMAKQFRLTNKLFADLLDCPLDREGYEAELRKQGVLR